MRCGVAGLESASTMTSKETDLIAREAARLFETGEAASLPEAIAEATERLGLARAEPPGQGRVRQHIRAMSMQALGGAAYAESVRDVMRRAEEVMTLLETSYDDVRTRLVGRAAKGLVDGGAELHIRVYTRRPLGEIAALLVAQGYVEPDFETANTRYGRLDRMRIAEDEVELVLTRCLPPMLGDAGRSLFTGRAIDAVDLAELGRRIAGLRIM